MKRPVRKRWKFELGARVKANEKAPGDYVGRVGTVVERGRGQSEYGIRFDDGKGTEYLSSTWLDVLS